MLKKTQSPRGMVQDLLSGHTSCTHFSHPVVEFTKVLTRVNVKSPNHIWLIGCIPFPSGFWGYDLFQYLCT